MCDGQKFGSKAGAGGGVSMMKARLCIKNLHLNNEKDLNKDFLLIPASVLIVIDRRIQTRWLSESLTSCISGVERAILHDPLIRSRISASHSTAKRSLKGVR